MTAFLRRTGGFFAGASCCGGARDEGGVEEVTEEVLRSPKDEGSDEESSAYWFTCSISWAASVTTTELLRSGGPLAPREGMAVEASTLSRSNPPRESFSFGTEAGLFQEIGISTVVCGPGSIEQAHKVDEFIELNELKKCIKFLNGLKSKSI
mgnify:CR=1 FL=1